MLHPFDAAYYSKKNRARISALAAADLDTVEQLWGGAENSFSFRNVLVGTPEKRSEIWHAWITTGDIELADETAFYVLRHRYDVAGKQLERWALYCALDIQEPQLYIHENVQPEGVERARQSTEACEADMAPIFVGCDQSFAHDLRALLAESVEGRDCLLTYREGPGAVHDVWALKVGPTSQAINAILEGAPLFLLDGHHRLAAAKQNHRAGLGDGKILACLCSMGHTDTLILPIHRSVRYERWFLPKVMLEDLTKAGCQVTELPGLKMNGIAAYLEKSGQTGPYCLVLHSHLNEINLIKLPELPSHPSQLGSLAVACLDYGVLDQYPQATPIPVTSIDSALEQLAVDQAQVAFFLPPASPAEVQAIALSNLTMPRKSTRFMPKPALGLVCRPWVSSG